MVPLVVMNLSRKAKTSVMVIVICSIISIHFRAPRFLVFWNVELHERFLLLVQLSILVVM